MNELTPLENPVDALKASFRLHASGVSILTCSSPEGAPVGFTATSVTSLGATPPLVSFNVARGSSSWPSLEKAEFVALHTLGVENLDLAKRMAADHTKRFEPTDWHMADRGVPMLDGVTSVLILHLRRCRRIRRHRTIPVALPSAKLRHGRQTRLIRRLPVHPSRQRLPVD
jgi:flavin reductase (DIM6/NTAB) family NADH-FMN oxidoreductase RutF